MNPNTLFLQPPQIDPWEYLPDSEARKTAGVKLTSPPSYWSDEITQNLLRDHPYISSSRVVVNFKRKDENNGHAIGYIGISGAPRVSIPVVIVNRELKPLDILVIRGGSDAEASDMEQGVENLQEDQVVPLNEQTFGYATDAGEIGTPITTFEARGTGWSEDGSALRLPHRGRTVLASAMGTTEEQKTAFHKYLEDKSILAGFSKPSLGDSGIWLQAHTEDFSAEGLQSKTAEQFSLIDIVNSWLGAPAPSDLIRQKIASAPVKRAQVSLIRDVPQERNVDSFTAALICCDDGSFKAAGVVQGVDLTDPQAGLQDWLLFEDGSYCAAPAKVAVAAADLGPADVLDNLTTRSLQCGSTLAFEVNLDGSQTCFTTPCKVASIATNEAEGSVNLKVANRLGQVFDVVLSRGVKVAMFDEASGAWVLPLSSPVLQLRDDIETVVAEPAKVATALARSTPDSLVCAGGQWTLNICGEPYPGAVQVGERKIAQVLDTWFDAGDELMAAAKERGIVRFDSNFRECIGEFDKAASRYQDYPEAAKELIDEIRAILPLDKAVKLAAALGDPEGADALLGTGFLSDDNLADFVNLADQFEDSVQGLARLLLAIRLGFPGDEAATVVAMKSLQRVTERLSAAAQQVGG